MSDKLPETLDEHCDYIERHADTIFIRHQREDGKWENRRLANMPAKNELKHAFRWIKRGQIPTRLRSADEIEGEP